MCRSYDRPTKTLLWYLFHRILQQFPSWISAFMVFHSIRPVRRLVLCRFFPPIGSSLWILNVASSSWQSSLSNPPCVPFKVSFLMPWPIDQTAARRRRSGCIIVHVPQLQMSHRNVKLTECTWLLGSWRPNCHDTQWTEEANNKLFNLATPIRSNC